MRIAARSWYAMVGYGIEGDKEYWKVKNSPDASWGDGGYIKLLRGDGGSGECCLLKQASYPRYRLTRFFFGAKGFSAALFQHAKDFSAAAESAKDFSTRLRFFQLLKPMDCLRHCDIGTSAVDRLSHKKSTVCSC